ncbi:putative oxidoreductase [Corynebacterium ciconiae DSM 44920]|uniref:GuaB3 family IMP dehydrogenase-related protein n=1 Tax=Corynebacterium ciconiae TaxID=227319 RepID=UPI000371D411|nr:GuaB3 family IMP dehydrogenase-related protein [Corynebacterium ciconiae]WKD60445.1 putative oxidoreductase [Corynebacterium ciconiae DSM 44920]
MRDIVEIGIGREARRTYSLNDIGLVPVRRTRSSKDVDTTWHFDAYTFDIPFLSHPTDSLASPEFVQAMADNGGLAVINAEGLWGRHADLDATIAQVVQHSKDNGPEATVGLLQQLHAAPLDVDLLTERIREVRAGDATVAVRVSPQHARDLAPVLVKAGAEIIVIQGTIISAEHVETGGEPLNLKEFIGTLDVPVIAGGVSDYHTALHLMRTGAAGVIVGGGSNTNDMAVGIHTPMASAIADVAAARRDYLDETGGRYVHIIADSDELVLSGNVARAMACGADAVMLGTPLAYAAEAAAPGWFWPSVTAHPRFPRGVVQQVSLGEELGESDVVPLQTLLHGPSTSCYGTENFVGGLRRAMAKCGYSDLKRFQKVELMVRNSPF